MHRQFRNVVKSLTYLTTLDKIEQKLKSSGNLDDAELKQLSEILEFCNIHSELKEAESEDISYLQLIQKCKKALESFVDYHTHSDFVSSIVSSEEHEIFVKELTKLR